MAENDRELAEILTGQYPGMVRKARSMLSSDMDAEDESMLDHEDRKGAPEGAGDAP